MEDFGEHERDKNDRKETFSRSSPETVDIRLGRCREKHRWPELFTETLYARGRLHGASSIGMVRWIEERKAKQRETRFIYSISAHNEWKD